MSLTARDLLDSRAITDDGAFPVRDLFYVPADWRLRYALLDVGGWLEKHEVLVSTDRLAPPTAKGWPLNMTGDELKSAPVIDTVDATSSVLPPLVVGPFGTTVSPLGIAAHLGLVSDATPDNDPQGKGAGDGNGRIFQMDRVSDLLGLEVFTDQGPKGVIEDLRLRDDMTLSHAIVSDGEALALNRLRRVADQGHAIFS
ncbi:hypothetical protein ILP92_02520 [Maribius pontilimi]|uniref:Uncharacterized protein n=1 Tax=Palleronia pontilimi TaxID=1964209 RepID=A0A934IGU9_9RHOB|nr:hypothetical protein [Palleronia pontilimi]MBJ3761624.1 hypothetical protein [Palleronia pontilimi]